MPDDKQRIRVALCLCPQRHLIASCAWDPALHTQEYALVRLGGFVGDMIRSCEIDTWCPLCGSEDWHTEVGETPFATMEEATPHLVAMGLAAQAARRAMSGVRPN